MDWDEACAPEGNKPFTEQSSLSPTPAQPLQNQSQLKAFLWGLGAAATLLTKPDPSKKKRKKNATECLNDSSTLIVFFFLISFSKRKLSFVVWVQLRNSCLRWREKAKLVQSWSSGSTPPPLSLQDGLGGWYRVKMWPHTLWQRTWTLCSDSWNMVSGIC